MTDPAPTVHARAAATATPRVDSRYRIAAWALAVLFAVSLAGNLVLVRIAQGYFRNTLSIRLDPAGLKTYAADRVKPLAGGPLLLFFGDSRAYMWPDPKAPTGFRVVNHGISYQTTEQILLRVDEDAASLHPSAVVLEAGVNDLKTIAEMPELRGQIVADCEANLSRIVDRLQESGATVILVSIFEIGDISLLKRPFWSEDVSAAVREVNAFLATLTGPKVVLFDANKVLDDGHGHVVRDYQMDYLHLLPAGYSALNAKLVPLLATIAK
jgi:lysophospholipase L1-like esterase